MVYEEPKAEWFKKFKETAREFKHKENIIESVKWRFEKETRLIEWIIGIGMALLLSTSIADVINSEKRWLVITGIISYLLSFLSIVISILLQVWVVSRQKKIMIFLYREKDKEARNS